MFAEVSPALGARLEKAAAPGKTWRKTLERILFFKASEVQQQQTGPCSFPPPCPCRAAAWPVAMGCCAELGCFWEEWHKNWGSPKAQPAQRCPAPPTAAMPCCAMLCLWDTRVGCQEVMCHGEEGTGTPFSPRPRGDAGLSPTDWREYDGRAPRRRGQAEALDHLLGQVKTVHQHCVCHGECMAQRCGEPGVGGPAGPPKVVVWSRGLGWYQE